MNWEFELYPKKIKLCRIESRKIADDNPSFLQRQARLQVAVVGQPQNPSNACVPVLYFVNLISCSVTSYNVGPRIPWQNCLERWHGQPKTILAGGHRWWQGTQWGKYLIFLVSCWRLVRMFACICVPFPSVELPRHTLYLFD